MSGALFGLGCIAFRKKEYQEAIRYFRELLDIDRQDHEVFYYLGCACQQMGLQSEGRSL